MTLLIAYNLQEVVFKGSLETVSDMSSNDMNELLDILTLEPEQLERRIVDKNKVTL